MRLRAALGGVLAVGLSLTVGCGAATETPEHDESTESGPHVTLGEPEDIPTGEYRARLWPASHEFRIEAALVTNPAYDPRSGRAFYQGFDSLQVLDLESGQILDSFTVDGNLEDLVYHPDTGMLVGADYENGRLLVVDPDTGDVVATGDNSETLVARGDPSVPDDHRNQPWQWVVLPDSGLLYAIDYRGSVEVLDPTTADVVDRAQVELPTPAQPEPFVGPWLSVNPATGEVLLGRSVYPPSGEPFGVLFTIDPVGHQVTNLIEIPAQPQGSGGLNASANVIWSASCMPGAERDADVDSCGLRVEAYDLSTAEVQQRLARPELGLRWDSGQVLAVDETHGRVFVLSADNVLVLDATTADVVGELAESGTLLPGRGGTNVGLVLDPDGDAYLFRLSEEVLPHPDGDNITPSTSVKAYESPQ